MQLGVPDTDVAMVDAFQLGADVQSVFSEANLNLHFSVSLRKDVSCSADYAEGELSEYATGLG